MVVVPHAPKTTEAVASHTLSASFSPLIVRQASRGCVPKADTCCMPETMVWMNNDAGQNPCQTVQALMQTCTPSFTLNVLTPDLTCPLIAGSGVPNPCCCSTVSFTLFAACFMCQSHAGSMSTYYAFLNRCGASLEIGSLPDSITPEQSAMLNVPEWAYMVPSQYNSSWNSTAALRNATLVAEQKDSQQHPARGISAAAVAAIIASLAIAAFLAAFFYLFRVRSQRHRRQDSRTALLDGTTKVGKFTISKPILTTTGFSTSHPRVNVDLMTEIDAPNMREPAAPRLPWENGRKLPVTKFDVQRDEYGVVRQVRAVPPVFGPSGIAGGFLNRWSRSRSSSDPPPPPPKPLVRRATQPELVSDPRAKRKPAPSLTPSLQREHDRYTQAAMSPQNVSCGAVYRAAMISPVREHRPFSGQAGIPNAGPSRLPTIPPSPPLKHAPLPQHVREPSPPPPVMSHTRERVRGPLMVRNSPPRSGSSSTDTETTLAPLAPSAQFIKSVSHPYHHPEVPDVPPLPNAVTLGIADRRPPDSFALGPPPTSPVRSGSGMAASGVTSPTMLEVLTDAQALYGYAIRDSRRASFLPLPLGPASPNSAITSPRLSFAPRR